MHLAAAAGHLSLHGVCTTARSARLDALVLLDLAELAARHFGWTEAGGHAIGRLAADGFGRAAVDFVLGAAAFA